MHKVTAIIVVMNTPSVLGKKRLRGAERYQLQEPMASTCASQQRSRCARTNTLPCERLSPKLIEPIACGKRGKRQNHLFRRTASWEASEIKVMVRVSISHACHNDPSSKCSSYRDVWTIVLSLHILHEYGSQKTKTTLEEQKKRVMACTIRNEWR